MPGSHLFNLGLFQKHFLSTSKVTGPAINIGCTRGRGSTTRMLNYCNQHSRNPSECINQFITVGKTQGVVSNVSTIYESTNPVPNSNPGNVQTVPGKPVITSITSGMDQVTVNFNPPYDGGSTITGYEYMISSGYMTQMVYELPSNYVITGFTIYDVSYNIQIRAINSIGKSDWSNTVVGIPTNYDSMGGGFSYIVNSIVLYGDYVFVGGNFTTNSSGTATYNRLAEWSTTNKTWMPLAVTNGNIGVDMPVYSIVQMGNSTSFYVGGVMYYAANSIALNGIGILDITSGTWTSIGNTGSGSGVYLNNGNSVYVYSVAYNSKYNVVYFGGMFDKDGYGNSLNNIASSNPTYNNINVVQDTNSDKGLNNQVLCITSDNNIQSSQYGNIYVGGQFTGTGSSNSTILSGIACYNPESSVWNNMSSGVNGTVLTIVIDPNDSNKIYVGGNFLSAGGGSVYNIACYNMETSIWLGLNGGPYGTVRTIAFAPNGDMYVGGTFTTVYTNSNGSTYIEVNSIAKWNSSTGWSQLNVQPQATSQINAITINPTNGIMYIGGSIYSVNSVPVYNIYQYQP